MIGKQDEKPTKAKVLVYRYDDCSETGIARTYYGESFELAESDLKMMQQHASDCKTWSLQETEIFIKKDGQ
jgi:hypothetical protein